MEDMEYKDYKLANGEPFGDGTQFARHYLGDDTWYAHLKDENIKMWYSKLYNDIVERGEWVEC